MAATLCERAGWSFVTMATSAPRARASRAADAPARPPPITTTSCFGMESASRNGGSQINVRKGWTGRLPRRPPCPVDRSLTSRDVSAFSWPSRAHWGVAHRHGCAREKDSLGPRIVPEQLYYHDNMKPGRPRSTLRAIHPAWSVVREAGLLDELTQVPRAPVDGPRQTKDAPRVEACVDIDSEPLFENVLDDGALRLLGLRLALPRIEGERGEPPKGEVAP